MRSVSLLSSVERAVSALHRSARIRPALAVVFGVGSGCFLVWTAWRHWSALADHAWRLEPVPLLMAGVSYCVAFTAGVLSWNLILRRIGDYANFWENTRIFCLSTLMKHLPGGVWYVLGRMYLYERCGVTRQVTAQSTVYETAIMVGTGLVITGVALSSSTWEHGLRQASTSAIWIGALAVAAIVGASLVLATKGLKARAGALGLGNTPAGFDLAMWVFIYFLAWGAGGSVLFFVIQAAWPIPLQSLPEVVAIWAVAGVTGVLAFFLPGGLGVREVSISLLLANLVPASLAVLIAVGFRAFLLLAELVCVTVVLAVVAVLQRRANGCPAVS